MIPKNFGKTHILTWKFRNFNGSMNSELFRICRTIKKLFPVFWETIGKKLFSLGASQNGHLQKKPSFQKTSKLVGKTLFFIRKKECVNECLKKFKKLWLKRDLNLSPPANKPRWHLTIVFSKRSKTLQIWIPRFMGSLEERVKKTNYWSGWK